MSSIKSIINDIESRIDYKKFYSKYIDIKDELDEGQFVCLCPFHEDDKPSFGLNTITGQWICRSGCGSGNVFSFLEKHPELSLDNKTARIKFLADYVGIDFDINSLGNEGVVDDEIWKGFHAKLLSNKGTLNKLKESRGLTLDTIKRFKLGWASTKVTIPIFDSKGACRNIRYYTFGKTKPQYKLINHTDDSDNTFGKMRIFPIDTLLKKKKIIMTEGEMDCILASQLGMPAITVTSGAGSFRKEWAPLLFEGKQVYICYDIDPAGKAGAIRVARMLAGIADWVKIVDLSKAIQEPPNADITNYFVDQSNTIADFRELMESAKEFRDVPEASKKLRNIQHKAVILSDASHSKNAMCHIEVKALVSGKDYPPFEVPNKVEVDCTRMAGDKLCPFCPLYKTTGAQTIMLQDEMDRGGPLDLIDISDQALYRAVRKIVGVPSKCDQFVADFKTYMNLEEVRLIPEIDFSTDANYEYVQQVAYYIGHGIKANNIYTFKGLALPHPKTQHSTMLFTEAQPAVDNIDSFKLTDEIDAELKKFQSAEATVESVEAQYQTRYDDIETVSGIYFRKDIALNYDIILHSPLSILFQDKVERGWMESLLIGDSGCGKTELAKAMIHHYGVGEFVTGESSSVAGLIGGLSQTSNKWHINWGKIPLNNRRALFIDEISGMSIDEIALFSGVRSSGIAELTKIRTEKTMAQTRKIWIGNPRKIGHQSRNMMEYPYGCVAVRDLIGNLEDIRRFDFVLTAHSEEVPTSVYNKRKDFKKPLTYTSKSTHDLILWIWSRKPEDVVYDSDAIDAVLEYSANMGKKYYHGIPIVEAADQRLKLMRGSASIAGLMYSTDDGKILAVKKCHVDFFYNWLEFIYNKPSMRYGDWSKKELSKRHLKNQDQVDMVVKDDIVDCLVENDVINQTILMDLTGWERPSVRNLLSTLNRNNAMKLVGTSYYRKTEAFILYLNKRLDGTITVDHIGQSEDDLEPSRADETPF